MSEIRRMTMRNWDKISKWINIRNASAWLYNGSKEKQIVIKSFWCEHTSGYECHQSVENKQLTFSANGCLVLGTCCLCEVAAGLEWPWGKLDETASLTSIRLTLITSHTRKKTRWRKGILGETMWNKRSRECQRFSGMGGLTRFRTGNRQLLLLAFQ